MNINPIPFNEEELSVKDAKRYLSFLRDVFNGLERHVDDENIMFHIRMFYINELDRKLKQ